MTGPPTGLDTDALNDAVGTGVGGELSNHQHSLTPQDGGRRRRRRSVRRSRRGGAYRSMVGTAVPPLALWAAQNHLGRSMGRHRRRSSGRKRRKTRRRRR